MNITSRVDAYLTNVNFPWEKKTETHVTVGALMLYRFKVENNSHSFEKLWVKSFPVQVIHSYFLISYILIIRLVAYIGKEKKISLLLALTVEKLRFIK